MTDWITITSPMDINSRVKRQPKLFTQEFGDGYIARVADGINNDRAEFSVAYRHISPEEHAQLLAFVKPLAKIGASVRVPLLPEDPTGATTGLFFIKDYEYRADEGGALWNWTINLVEVFV